MSEKAIAMTQSFQISMSGIGVATDRDHVHTTPGGDIHVDANDAGYQLVTLHVQTDGRSVRIVGDLDAATALEVLQTAVARVSMLIAEHGVREY